MITTPPLHQHVQDLQKNITHIIPNLTEIPDPELVALVTLIERTYAHVLIEAGFRGVVEY